MENHQLINQSSGDVEIYTPPDIRDRVYAFMGRIDLDPASSVRANESIGALEFFTAPEYTLAGFIGSLPVRRYHDHGGLDRPWHGHVWMNPPFLAPDSACLAHCQKKRCAKRGWHTATALPGTPDWVNKLCAEYTAGHVTRACCITFAATSEAWFQPLLKRPICFPYKRTNYLLPDGSAYKGVTKGSAITCFGPVGDFPAAFGSLGEIKVSYEMLHPAV